MLRCSRTTAAQVFLSVYRLVQIMLLMVQITLLHTSALIVCIPLRVKASEVWLVVLHGEENITVARRIR